MIKTKCPHCGEKKELVKSWISKNRWEWKCWDCVEDDDDGYVVMLS